MEDIRSGSTPDLPDPLTSREYEIMKCICEGLSNQEIANRLYLAEKTVRWYNTQIYSKLGVGSRQEAVERALALGLLDAISDALPATGKHNLPAQATRFVGRQRQLDELAGLLADSNNRLVTILAPGGMGKTRLALEAAHMQIRLYTDGVYFVPLAPLSAASDIVTTIAESIGFNFFGENPPAKQLIDFLQDRSMLLVLDNFEHLLDGVPLVADLIRVAPNLRVLTTSRERLGLRSETVYTLHGLDFSPPETPADALEYDVVKLFMQSAHRVRPDFDIQADNLDYLARVCRLTGGMPLGIELAAGWVDTLTLEQIAAEIQRSIDILETEMRDVPERQRSIRATFERTWERLSDDEQRVFLRLSVFRGGFTIDAAKEVADANFYSLRKLANKAMVQTTPDGRHDIHELLRQFGLGKLQASGDQTQVEAKHADFFADFVAERKLEIKTDRQLEALALIEPDFENVRASWLYTINQGKWDQLPKFLFSLWFYLLTRTRGQVALELLEHAVQALRAAPASVETELTRGRVLARLGWFYNDIGFSSRASAVFEEAINILRQYDSPEDLLTALHGQQNVHTREQWAVALSASQEGLSTARAIGDKYWEAHILIYAGLLDDVRRELVTARQFTEEALEAFLKIGDRWGLMITYITLGRIAMNQKLYSEARSWFQQTQPLAKAFGSVWNLISLHNFEAAMARGEQNYTAARREYLNALKFVWNGGYRWLTPRLLTHIAAMFAEQNMLENAVEILGTIQKHPLAFGQTNQIAQTMRDELQAQLETEQFAAAWALGQNKELSVLVQELLAEAVDVS